MTFTAAPEARDSSVIRRVMHIEALPYDERGRLLIVQPASAREGWALVGGVTRQFEPLAAALGRMGREQVGVALRPTHMLVTDQKLPELPARPQDDVVYQVMATRPLSNLEVSALHAGAGQVERYKLVNRSEAAELLDPAVFARVNAAWNVLAGKREYSYLENGRPVLLPQPVLAASSVSAALA